MLLYGRSIILEVCLILIVTKEVISAEYDYSAEEDEYYSPEYSDDHSHPDYTKYFGGAVSASTNNKKTQPATSGFVDPAEFESFFNSPINFGVPIEKESESQINPLQKDYFEESQKKQQTEESHIPPGPHYVSHQIPVPHFFNSGNDEDKAQSKDDVETIPPPLKGKHKKKGQIAPARPGFDGFKDSFDAFGTLRKTEEQIEQTKTDPTTLYGVKNIDYNTGKSSSTVSQYPAAAGYLSSIATTTLSPYQKYSFQPVTVNYEALQSKYLEALASTIAPLKNLERASLHQRGKDDGATAPSENIPENLKNKDCRKINGPENAENMNCFVCEDASNKAKYTQCSYTSSEQPVNEFAGSSVRYSLPVKAPNAFRYKRSLSRKYNDDPYLRISQSNRKYFEDFEKEQEAAESERKKDFHYKPYEPDYESYSESQSSELLKTPGACQKVDREGMTCTVCKNSKTGGNFEQCSYTSAPKEHKYAYVAEKKYDSEDEPEESKIVTKQSSEDPQKSSQSADSPRTAPAPADKFSSATKSKIIKDPIPELTAAGTTVDETSEEKPETEESEEEEEESESNEESDDEESDDKKQKKEESDDSSSYFDFGELKKNKKLVSDDPYNVPEHFAASVGQEKSTEADDEEEESFDEYHYKLFPELNKKDGEESEEQKPDATEQKPQDVEEVLAEFAKKDRSNCKKAQKNGMTCFLCVDQNKIQHEECMYIAESKPRPTHIAYHEVQRLKDPKGEHQPLISPESDSEESKKVETVSQKSLDPLLPLAAEKSKKKKFFKKVITTPLPLAIFEQSAAASEVYKTVVPFERSKTRYTKNGVRDSKASGSAPDSEKLEDEPKKESEEPQDPKEIDVGDEEGAYSHETKPIYSKQYGTVLPKYMVEKTEFEKDFDAAAGFD